MATLPNPEHVNLSQGTEKTLRLVRPSIIVLCGPAACGKTTFAERHFRATQIISSDWARGRVCDDERDQRYQAQAFALVHFLIEQRLSLNRLCVVDSTALTPQARKDLLDLARRFQVPSIALLFESSLEKCVERDQTRERRVGRTVIERQYQLFEQAKGTIRQEGFEQVIDLRDEDLDKIRIEIIFRPVSRPAPAPVRSGPGAWRRQSRQGGPIPAGPTVHAPARLGALPQPDPAHPLREPPDKSDTATGGVERRAAAQGPARPLAQPTAQGQTTPPAPAQGSPTAPPKADLPSPVARPASPSTTSDSAVPTPPPGIAPGGPQDQGKT